MGLPVNNLQYLASALATGSVKTMAQLLKLNPPISVLGLIRAFALSAAPRVPENLWPSIIGEDDTATKLPVTNLVLSWTDSGAGRYWAATDFDIVLEQQDFSSGASSVVFTGSASQTSFTYPGSLAYDGAYQWMLFAKNKFGGSAMATAYFGTTSKPAKGSQQPGVPQPAAGYSKILFHNCSSSKHTAHFWMQDLTAGGQWAEKGVQDAQYDDNGMCPGSADPMEVDLLDGHTYLWAIVDPDQLTCEGRNDPMVANCIAWPASQQAARIVGSKNGPVLLMILPGS